MLTVACAYRPGNGFTNDYVCKLQVGISKHLQTDYRFVCLTNEEIPGVECVKPRGDNKGWWIKLHLFTAFREQTVYLDLDTMLIDDVTDIFTYPHTFTGLTGLKTKRFASGFMAWNGDFSYLDADITPAIDAQYRETWTRWGDQGWIDHHLKIRPELTGDLFPGRFVSYKWDIRRQGVVPKGASVVVFSGEPRPHTISWSLPDGIHRNKQ